MTVPDINDDSHVIRPKTWKYKDRGSEAGKALLSHADNLAHMVIDPVQWGEDLGTAAYDIANPADLEALPEDFVPTWFVGDDKNDSYKNSLSTMTNFIDDQQEWREKTASQLQDNYDIDSLNWLSTRTQNFVDILAPEKTFRERYTIRPEQNYRSELDTYQREMYEAYQHMETGWHTSKAEDMSKTDAFYFMKYQLAHPDSEQTHYVDQDYFMDKTDTNMVTRLEDAHATVMAGEHYDVQTEFAHPQGTFEMPEKEIGEPFLAKEPQTKTSKP